LQLEQTILLSAFLIIVFEIKAFFKIRILVPKLFFMTKAKKKKRNKRRKE
jgi:hypothetical protein